MSKPAASAVPPTAALSVSRFEIDMRTHTENVEQVFRDQDRLLASLARMHESREKMIKEHRVTVDAELKPAVAALYSAWKQDQQRQAALEIASAEMGVRQ